MLTKIEQREKALREINKCIYSLKKAQTKHNFDTKYEQLKEKGNHYIALSLNKLREHRKFLLMTDMLKYRQDYVKYYREGQSNGLLISYYRNNDDTDFCDESTDECNIRECKYVFPYITYILNNNGDPIIWHYNNREFYASDILEIKKSGQVKKPRERLRYYKVGNEYFEKEKYFLFEGKVCDREKYELLDGKLVDLSDTLSLRSRYNAKWREEDAFKKKYYLKKEDCEEFIDKSVYMEEHPYMKIIVGCDCYRSGLFDNSLFLSMFKIGNKRMYSKDGYFQLYLNKEEVMQLEFLPTQEHKRIINKMFIDFSNYKMEKIGRQDSKEQWNEHIKNMLNFQIEVFPEEKSGIKASVFKEVFDGRKIRAEEINGRLKLLKELLTKEKWYAERKQSSKDVVVHQA